MARYNVRYACGHGTVVKQLVGPERDRRRYIAWHERNVVCPECYRQQRAQDAPRGVEILWEITRAEGTRVMIRIRITGDTYPHRDALREAGYRWDDAAREWWREEWVSLADAARGAQTWQDAVTAAGQYLVQRHDAVRAWAEQMTGQQVRIDRAVSRDALRTANDALKAMYSA